ncbi:MAG: NADH-quinone oxidoreductase subunit C [Mesoaciditoga sp.]|uniref:NADH-quinone oxidoreductase subunit C n=1 Tax=Athalassotoga sp. TaxID=2022597 RepID=UPI000CAC2FB5|nr:MAG: NADH-quinone oxidoreductase subunit C [Mesoaciditoga sp.]HEU24206.1 NADH-quinone oxidoreductase subunit C [Mesoaciditoga lauensis]
MADILDEIKSMDLKASWLGDWEFEVFTPKDRLVSTLSYLKAKGFKAFMGLSCVDWIEEGNFELVYILQSYDLALETIVKTKIPRQRPVIESMGPLWKLCEVYEREMHEFFGIEFTGNPNLKPFFLENWLDIPPLRKDFDTLAFSEELFEFKEDETHGIESPKRIE